MIADATFRRLARLHERHPRRVLAAVVLLTAAAAWPLSRARFSGDLTDLLPEESRAAQAFRLYREAFEQSDQLVLVAVDDGAGARPGAGLGLAVGGARLAARAEVRGIASGPLEALSAFAERVVPSAGFAYLSADEAAALRATLEPEGLARAFARSVRLLEQSPGLETAELVRRDPLFLREILAERAAELLGGGASGDGDGLALLTLTGQRPAQDVEASKALMAAVAAEIAAAAKPAHLRLLVTGGYAIAVEDEARVRGDLQLSTLVSIGLVLVLFVLAYRGLRPLLLVSVALALGIAWGYAAFLLARGGITMITAVGAAMLVGLGIDVGVHLYAELAGARGEGLGPAGARAAMIQRAGPRVAVAALTTAGCFLAFGLTGFRGLADLGLLAGLGMVACLAAFLLVLPRLLARHEPAAGRAPMGRLADAIGEGVLRRPRAALAVAGALTLGAAVVLATRGAPGFVADARMLHPEHSPALDALHEIDRLVSEPLVPWVVIARGQDAGALSQDFARMGGALAPLLEDGTLERIELPSRVLPPAEAQRAAFAALAGLDPEATAAALRAEADAAGFDPDAFAVLEAGVRENLARAARGEVVTLAELGRIGGGELAGTFFRARDGGLVAAGFLFPGGGLFGDGELGARIERIGQALRDFPDASLTGFPIVSQELAALVRDDFRSVTLLATGVVVLLVLAASRSLRATLLALVPIAVSFLWLLAAMRLLGTGFNVMNVVLLPMLVGLGVDHGVHLVFETRRRGDVAAAQRAVLLPILLSSVTTIAGLGSLATVDHPAIASMGELTAAGSLLGLAATVLVLPPLLRGATPAEGPRPSPAPAAAGSCSRD